MLRYHLPSQFDLADLWVEALDQVHLKQTSCVPANLSSRSIT